MKKDPINNEDVDLIQFLQGARVRDIYKKGTTEELSEEMRRCASYAGFTNDTESLNPSSE